MKLELVKSGELNSTELTEKIKSSPPPPSSPSLAPPASSSPTSPSSNRTLFHDICTVISKDGTLLAVGKYNLLLLFKVGGNWKITQIENEEIQSKYVINY